MARRSMTASPSISRVTARRFLSPRKIIVQAGVIIAMTFAAYAPALTAGFVWDDDVYVTENPSLHDVSGLEDMWLRLGTTRMYVPLTFTTLWAEYQLWDTQPAGYHVVNIALHAAGALLLWVLLVRLALPNAWLAAAIFAVHPVFVESVAWVTELKNTQSTLFGLLCLLAHLSFLPPEGDREARRRWTYYVLALLAFAAALLSKPVVVGLPIVILLLVWWRRGRLERIDLVSVVPMLMMSLAAGLVAMHIERVYAGAQGGNWELPLLDRILVAGRAFWFYVGKLLWPAELIPIYPRWRVSSAEWWQYAYPVAAAVVLIGLWRHRARLGRGPFTAVACFAVLLAPLSGIFNVSYHLNSYVADHFQHHGAPALIALFAVGAAATFRRIPRAGSMALVAGALLLAVLTLLSIRHTSVFRNEEARCRDTLAKNPAAWVAMNNLGVALNARGAPREAVEWFERAIRARPPYPEAHNNLGVALVALGDLSGAMAHYEEALRDWPDYPQAHNNMGTVLARLGRVEEAVKRYEEAVRLKPDYAEARENLAKLLVARAATGAPSHAATGFETAIRVNPASAEAHNGLGMELAREGKFNEAIRQFEVAVRLRPDYAEARNNLGTALSSTGDTNGAIAQYAEAIRIQPDYAQAHGNLGMALVSVQRPAEAVHHFEEALRTGPDDATTRVALGVALAQTGKLDQAIVQFERAIEIDPANTDARFNLERARGMKRSPDNP